MSDQFVLTQHSQCLKHHLPDNLQLSSIPWKGYTDEGMSYGLFTFWILTMKAWESIPL